MCPSDTNLLELVTGTNVHLRDDLSHTKQHALEYFYRTQTNGHRCVLSDAK